jgi:2-dehydropantoate 2-reductase
MQKLNFLFFGAGAIGTYIGGSLAAHGQHVTFIEQPNVIAELRERGLRIDYGKYLGGKIVEVKPDQFDLYPSLTDALNARKYDVAIFALKSFDTQDVLDSILAASANAPHPFPPILCLQNGVENEQKIASALGADHVIIGSVTSAIGRKGTGDMLLDKYRGIGIGSGADPVSAALINAIIAAMDDALLLPKLVAHPLDMKWSKLIGNQLTSAVSAIVNMTPEEVLSNDLLYELEMEQIRETLRVMKALGIKPINLPGAPTGILALASQLPRFLVQPLLKKLGGSSRGAKMPSFHIDLYAGRSQSEVEFLHGAVVRFGEKSGVPTPVNKMLTETLLKLTRKEIPLNTFDHQPEKLLALLKNDPLRTRRT